MNDERALAEVRAALLAELDSETLKLVKAASDYGPVEAVMRVRALAEIAQFLATEELLNLALITVENSHQSSQRGR
jgi:hypothetical protein